MAVSGVYAGGVGVGVGVGAGGAAGECAGVYRGGAGVYGVAAFHHHPQLHHHHHAAHPAAAWLAPYAALIPPAHPTHHAAHPAHPAHIPIDSVPSQYVSTSLLANLEECSFNPHRNEEIIHIVGNLVMRNEFRIPRTGYFTLLNDYHPRESGERDLISFLCKR